MKVFVTGATGYLGHRLVNRLAANGEEVNILVRDTTASNIPIGYNVNIFQGDITNTASISNAINGCTQVYHCAAIAKFNLSDRDAFFQVNVEGVKNILQASLNSNVQKLVFTSSAAVLGPSLATPLTEADSRIVPFESDYDLSKHLAEKLVNEYVKKGLNAVIVNPSRIYGPGPATYSNGINRMIELMMKKKMLVFPEIGKYISNYTFIDDVISGHLLAMQKGKAGENYILGGENISYKELLTIIKEYAGTKTQILKLPVPVIKSIACISHFFNRNTELTPSLITRFAKHRMVRSDKAVKELGYSVTPFKEGIQETIGYLKNKQYQTKINSFKLNQHGKNPVSARTH